MEMVEEEDRADALSAIALVERLAQVTTIGVFGALVSSCRLVEDVNALLELSED